MLYDQVADLELEIDKYELSRHKRETSSGFSRVTTIVALHGSGEVGRGEDVTYEDTEHEGLDAAFDDLSLSGSYRFDKYSAQIGRIDLFPDSDPSQSMFRQYRRWAFESAALDLALKQDDTNLAARLGRTYEPVRFVVSTRLAEPPTGDRIIDWLERNPSLEFKLDPTSEWTEDVIDRLATTSAVRLLDLKGQYHDTTVDQPADPPLYERVIERFPNALIEDPDITDETRPILEPHADRVTWDYPIRGVESIEQLPWEPEWLNIKPSRFGSVESLFETLDYCQSEGIHLYGGGQFELGVGREHLHVLASLFYPDSPNDVAPTGYNDPEPVEELPISPLDPPQAPDGLEWRHR